jgi:hypothetical protein
LGRIPVHALLEIQHRLGMARKNEEPHCPRLRHGA